MPQSNSVCSATAEKQTDGYAIYATALEPGEHDVTLIGLYYPIVMKN